MLEPAALAEALRAILSRSSLSPGLPIRVELIANPTAGGFTRAKYARRRAVELADLVAKSRGIAAREGSVEVELQLTDSRGHATELARKTFARHRGAGYPDALRILATAGGDGTSLEAVSALMELDEAERGRWLVLRLPLGTGNDGSDGRDLVACLGRFLGSCAIESRSALRVTFNPAGGKPAVWSFNIASLGADAFVGELTNSFKTRFPGDSYKVMLDLAAVIYDLIWPSRPMRLVAEARGGTEAIEGACLLVAMGASGNRQYGSNKRILPGEENLCYIPRMSLWGKLRIKGPISSGEHRRFPMVRLLAATRARVEYPDALLFQSDGEVLRLEAADFPLEISVVSGAYRATRDAAG